MAITRTTAISKPQQQQQQQDTPASVAETNSISNNSSEQHQQQEQQQQQQIVSDYEQTREKRIKENRERLQKLGIVDLSLQLTSLVASSKRTPKRNYERRTPLKSPSFGPSSDTPRRSSRLQNAPPVTYTEVKEEKSRRPRDIVLEEGAKPELYTEEHEKLLGNTKMPWTFGVDGYGANGARIYDSVVGKTCHQCRQKTLGLRTSCCKCDLVQGQFCGDCLMARYGEHVVEANQNPNWICPPCRGICNCSLCRQAKGWYPTGAIYRTISNLGYKSVAHYLIATKRAPPVSEMSSDAPQPAKRSIPFEGMEEPNDNEPNSKAMVESTETNQQSENNAIIVYESDPKSASAGRTRKRAKKEERDASEDSVKVTDKSDLKKASVGRPRKNPKKETNDAGEDSVKVTDKSDLKKARVGRPRKKPMEETNDAGEDSVKVTEKSDLKKASVGRPRKKPQEETNDAGEDKVKASVGRPRKEPKKETNDAEDVPSAAVNGPNTPTFTASETNSTPVVRRSTRKSKNENDDVVIEEESVETSAATRDEAVSTMNGPNISDSKEDSVARRLRSRDRT